VRPRYRPGAGVQGQTGTVCFARGQTYYKTTHTGVPLRPQAAGPVRSQCAGVCNGKKYKRRRPIFSIGDGGCVWDAAGCKLPDGPHPHHITRECPPTSGVRGASTSAPAPATLPSSCIPKSVEARPAHARMQAARVRDPTGLGFGGRVGGRCGGLSGSVAARPAHGWPGSGKRSRAWNQGVKEAQPWPVKIGFSFGARPLVGVWWACGWASGQGPGSRPAGVWWGMVWCGWAF
jgi:hypothetical protein